ncbi:MAG: prolipoprotein diacylglyceryl transferase family protein, partial [Solirubrobacteraceae bacterium]
MSLLAAIPSPARNGFYIGPLFFHAYGIAYVFAVAAAIFVARRRWARVGGDPDLVYEVAMWAFPAGLIGGRLYFDLTTPSQIPDHWWGVFAIWEGGLGIWGGIAAGAAVGLLVARRRLGHDDLLRFMDAAAPGLLCAQAIGRIGNYFNQELFGAPSSLPWALKISLEHRPPGYLQFATFEPTFLYELIWNLALAAFLV